MEQKYYTLDQARARIASRLGRRVPMATIAKWARKGWLSGAVRVHTGGRGRDGKRWLVPARTTAEFVPRSRGRRSRAEEARRAVAAVLGQTGSET